MWIHQRECTQVQLKVIQVVSYVILRRHIFWSHDAFYPLLLITAGASIWTTSTKTHVTISGKNTAFKTANATTSNTNIARTLKASPNANVQATRPFAGVCAWWRQANIINKTLGRKTARPRLLQRRPRRGLWGWTAIHLLSPPVTERAEASEQRFDSRATQTSRFSLLLPSRYAACRIKLSLRLRVKHQKAVKLYGAPPWFQTISSQKVNKCLNIFPVHTIATFLLTLFDHEKL